MEECLQCILSEMGKALKYHPHLTEDAGWEINIVLFQWKDFKPRKELTLNSKGLSKVALSKDIVHICLALDVLRHFGLKMIGDSHALQI